MRNEQNQACFSNHSYHIYNIIGDFITMVILVMWFCMIYGKSMNVPKYTLPSTSNIMIFVIFSSLNTKAFLFAFAIIARVYHISTLFFAATKIRAHYNDVIMSTMMSQITSLTIVYSSVYSGADQRKHQSSASLAFVLGIHRGPVNSPHKGPVTRKMFPFDDVIMLPCIIPAVG